MKHSLTLTLILTCSLSLSLSAKVINVAADGSIQTALNQAVSGDIVRVANGTYYESLTVGKGVTLEGGDNTVISGINFTNKRGIYNNGTVRHIIVEFFTTQEDGGGIYNNAGVVEYCTVRGCQGKEASIWNSGKGILRNCLMYNNQPSRDSWPNSGGFYNPKGQVYNCTSARNFGHYAGWHAESCVVNSVAWGIAKEEGFTDHSTYTSSGATGSAANAADDKLGSFFSVTLNADNNATSRAARFIDPTPFAGAPTTDDEREAIRLADYRIAIGSALINKGKDTEGVPTEDLLGTPRPRGVKYDIGAYEFDSTAPAVNPTSIALLRDTLRLMTNEKGILVKKILPLNATDKACVWSSSDTCVKVNNGMITPSCAGQAVVSVRTANFPLADSAVVIVTQAPTPYVCPEVRLADSLYHIEDYTVPSYIPMWIAKEAARKDSCQERLDTLQMRIDELIGKEEPYCVVANIHGDPTTSMGFCWFTNNGINDGQIQLVAKANATAEDFLSDVMTVEATPTTTKPLRYAVSNSGILKATGMKVTQTYTYVSHKVVVDSLTPGTQYSYRVGYAGHWSDIRSFRTADANQGAFSFLYMTDSHLMNKEYVDAAEMCANAARKNESDIRFLMFTGDHVETGDNGNSEWEWERWFEQCMRPVLSQMPVAPTDGNHDDSGNLNYTYHFNTDNQFNKETKVKPQFEGITYSFVYGDVLFLGYSMQDYWRGSYSLSNESSIYLTRDVGNWFRRQVSAHPRTKWRVAFVHFNTFSGSGHQEDEETPMFRACMLPIFKELEIDVVMQGHDHCYEIIGPVDPDTRTAITSAITDVQSVTPSGETNITGKKGGTYCVDDGTLYFIGSTCGAKRYGPKTKAEMDADFDKHKVTNYFDLFTGMFGQPGAPSYTRVDAAADSLVFHSYKTDKLGNSKEYNAFRVVRTKAHSDYHWDSLDEVPEPLRSSDEASAFVYEGQMYISKNDQIYSILGQRVK